ncbi:Hpt domain-containing protein [Pseudarthrobacter equi]|uniref:Hpt domain-containing protein n=1 Tax=Pseudarthrobacter equi TaxID=728066 RepID=UPI0021BE26FA|nr:Hpt domain-containing protein [Pseudarthrobacter equi]MCT9625587.1 Hpt domain-containing protein [Pseudarthrobacter equi]
MSGDCVSGSGGPGTCVLDPGVLERLRSELDDDEGWRLFLSNFLAHLPRRIEKLRGGLVHADYEVSMDAVLSLKISCQMVGAERLAGLALQLQRQLGVLAGREQAVSEWLQLIEMFEDIAALAGETGLLLGITVAAAAPSAG